MKLSN